jgi:transposase-like protein
VGKKRVGRYPMEFRLMVIERMKQSNNITVLAKELGLERSQMYVWKRQLDPERRLEERPPATREEQLERRVSQLEGALATKTMELDFFRGALQTVEARRRQRRNSGGKTSTTTSEE